VLATQESLRAVLKQHSEMIHYVTVDLPSILADLDTPADYEQG
jgi:hypothetical protein